MKIKTIILSAMLVSPTVFANTSANINVLGEIKPPTCLINGASQSDIIFSLPTISPKFLLKSSSYDLSKLEKVKKEITVICDAETYLTFKTSDAYASTGSSMSQYPYYFSLVSSKETEKSIGSILFSYTDIKVDSNKAYISAVLPSGNTNVMVLYKNALTGWSKSENDLASNAELFKVLKSGKVFAFSINNEATYIDSIDRLTASGIDLASEVNYQGEVVLTFNFGV
ncbi:MAG: fimbrial protein [Providencia heimbachae]|nr:fimbrial protein [Providencia heimbachae]